MLGFTETRPYNILTSDQVVVVFKPLSWLTFTSKVFVFFLASPRKIFKSSLTVDKVSYPVEFSPTVSALQLLIPL